MNENDIKAVALRQALQKLEERQSICTRDERVGLLQARIVLIDMLIQLLGGDDKV